VAYFVPPFSLQFLTLPTRVPLLQKPEVGFNPPLAEAASGVATNIPAMKQANIMFVNFVIFDPPPDVTLISKYQKRIYVLRKMGHS